jgi:hypothetical protein
MTDHIHCIHQVIEVIEAAAPRWTFEGGIRDAAQETLAALCHNEDDQMEYSQYATSQVEPVKEMMLWCCLP